MQQVRQLAATMMGQPAKVMIGNRDELKANQVLLWLICHGISQATPSVRLDAGCHSTNSTC